MPTVSFHTLGCKVNQYDSEAMKNAFCRRGYQVVGFDDVADVYVINTCTVTGEGERKSRQMARKARRKNPDALVVVAGCLPQVEPDEALAIEGVNLVVGTADRHRIVDLVEEARGAAEPLCFVEDLRLYREFEETPLDFYTGRARAAVKIQEGCTEFCSYCIVPLTRGHLRSRRPENVLAEVERLVEAGFREIVLTGIHLGAYGRDLGQDIDLAGILRQVAGVSRPARVRLSSVEPMDVTPGLLETMASLPQVCHHLHMPLQSGSDAVLKRMNRRYSVSEFRDLALKARRLMPDLGLTTDVMVGFPGETEVDFRLTCETVRELAFSRLHVFPYSPRPGTKAAVMSGPVSRKIKHRRRDLLVELGRELAAEFAAGFVGKRLEVLVEDEAGPEPGWLEGYSSNYIRVVFPGPESLKGRLVPVVVTSAAAERTGGKLDEDEPGGRGKG